MAIFLTIEDDITSTIVSGDSITDMLKRDTQTIIDFVVASKCMWVVMELSYNGSPLMVIRVDRLLPLVDVLIMLGLANDLVKDSTNDKNNLDV